MFGSSQMSKQSHAQLAQMRAHDDGRKPLIDRVTSINIFGMASSRWISLSISIFVIKKILTFASNHILSRSLEQTVNWS